MFSSERTPRGLSSHQRPQLLFRVEKLFLVLSDILPCTHALVMASEAIRTLKWVVWMNVKMINHMSKEVL